MRTFSTLLSLLVASVLLTPLASCIVQETESFSVYFIDNRSSVELNYTSPESLNEEVVFIPPGVTAQIDRTGTLGSDGFQPDDYYAGLTNSMNEDLFLNRDSSGIAIEALQLNTQGVLNWTEVTISSGRRSFLFHYILAVTDDMIQ